MKKVLKYALMAVLAFFGVTYTIFKLDMDGKTLHFIEPYVHLLCGHSKKW